MPNETRRMGHDLMSRPQDIDGGDHSSNSTDFVAKMIRN